MIIRKKFKNESVPSVVSMAGKQIGKILVTKAIEALIAKAKEKLEQGVDKGVVADDLAVDILKEVPASVKDSDIIDFVEVILPNLQHEGCGKKAKKMKKLKKEDLDMLMDEDRKCLVSFHLYFNEHIFSEIMVDEGLETPEEFKDVLWEIVNDFIGLTEDSFIQSVSLKLEHHPIATGHGSNDELDVDYVVQESDKKAIKVVDKIAHKGMDYDVFELFEDGKAVQVRFEKVEDVMGFGSLSKVEDKIKAKYKKVPQKMLEDLISVIVDSLSSNMETNIPEIVEQFE